MRDKSYRATPVGGEVGGSSGGWDGRDRLAELADAYEIVLSRLSLDFAHLTSLDQFTTDGLRDFLDEHWGDSAPATRRNRLAIVKSFFRFCVDERGLAVNPADKIKPPRKASVERQAYAPDTIEQLAWRNPHCGSKSPSGSSVGWGYARTSFGSSRAPTST